MYAIVGPFAVLKLYAKNLMRQAYKNQILLKLAASIISLVVGSQVAYKYRYQHTFIWLTSSLLILLLNYWYIIPFILIYILPIINKFINYWFKFIDLFSNKILRPYSTKFCQILPSIWIFELNQKLWPIESIRIMLIYGSIGPAIYCGYEIYSYLFFGISFNVCISISITILVTTTLWHILEAIDRHLYPFIFAIIIQYYIIPIKSFLNIPLTILLTTFLFPWLNNLLISNSIQEFINNITLLNIRTYLEGNNNYRRFYCEFVNLFIIFYLIYHVFISCLINNVLWLLIILIISLLFIYLYTNLIYLILFQPNIIMFLFSSFILCKYIIYRRIDEHFISKYFLLIMLLTFYFALIYPLLYHILRRSIIKSAYNIGLKLQLFREKINQKRVQFSKKYLSITYIHDPSKYFILHLCNIIITICILIILPINILLRLVLSLLTYLLIGRLLLTHGLEILRILTSLCISITAGAHVYDRYNNSLILTMSIALITYICTFVITFPMIYRFVQFILIHFSLVNYLNDFLQNFFSYTWSYFDIFWPHIKESFYEVKTQIEQSKINIFHHSRNVQ
ncbi:unnamed protein product [Rotaria sordida]|uniref:Uncharacterized protein n=1 Tax=Rotaria sordida TaxID=392033 RepID=A0A813T411_9BILA|nr:unnamed protein product [Rotaria sordida]CAF0855118.1 unnamed protein product [Rotaria sordida]CAF3475921.1 unnamed protein product [Rotaria sordida]CAF3620162.1 unnamed protein product [Rotaria sordida]